jgi:hypothetical protein
MKKLTYLLLPFLIAAALRLYPYFVSGLPFSVDAWAPIRNAELLTEQTPIRLDDKIFDGYNSYWPANSLFGAFVSQVTGVEPLQAMAVFLPLTGSIAILIFYVLVKKLYNAKISFMASIIFGTAFTHAYFTAGVTKETFANPLYFLLILIFLHPTISKRKQALLFAITAVTLVFAHHLTPLITIPLLLSIAIARFITNTRKGLEPNKSDFLLVSTLAVAITLYFWLYALAGFKYTLTLSDLLSAASYQIVTFSLAMYVTLKPSTYSKTRTLFSTSAAIAVALFLTLLLMKKPILPGVPVQPTHYLLYDLPYILLPPLFILGYGYHRQNKTGASKASIFWFASVIGVGSYALFSNSPFSMSLTYRTLNFLNPIAAIFVATGLYRLTSGNNAQAKRLLGMTAVVATILIIVASNVYSMYASVSLQERYMGYVWLYTQQEFEAGNWIANRSNVVVAGDLKTFHFFHDYYALDVDVLKGYEYLTDDSETPPQILYIYGQMQKNGYVIGYYGLDLPENYMEKVSQLNQIYSNGYASFHTAD